MAVTLWGQAPELETDRHAAFLSWEQSEISYILTESPTVDGLYTPSLLPMIFGGNRAAVVTSEPSTRFFQLAQGGQVLEDFSRGTDYAWNLRYLDEVDEGKWQLSYPDGAPRIQKVESVVSGPVFFEPPTWASGSWPRCADVSMSVDILDWDENGIGQTIAFGARTVSNPGGDDHANGYWPRLTIEGGGSEQASFWNGELTNGQWNQVDGKSFNLGPKKPLRLIYSLAGGVHTTAVFDLSDLRTPISRSTGVDHSFTEGFFMVWIGDGETVDAADITIDNVVMTWTSP